MSEMNPIPFAKALGKPSQAAIDSAVSDWLDDHPEATTTVEDGSITKAKLDSNLQGTVDDVADLKSAVTDNEKTFEMFAGTVAPSVQIANDFVNGKRFLTNGFADVANYACSKFAYPAGKYIIEAISPGWVAIAYVSDTEGTAIIGNWTASKTTFTAESAFYITFNAVTTTDIFNHINTDFVCKRILNESGETLTDRVADLESDTTALDGDVGALSDKVDSVITNYKSANLFNGVWINGETIKQSDGSFIEYESYARTDYIPVKAGKVNIGFKFTASTASQVVVNYCVYNSSKEKVTFGNGNALTVFSGTDMQYSQITVANDGYIALVIYSQNRTLGYFVTLGDAPASFVDYYPEETYLNPALIPPVISSVTYGKTPGQAKSASVSDGDTMTVESNSLLNNYEISFFAKVTTFDKLIIGHGKSSYGYYIKIDNTNVTYGSNGSYGTAVAHELTIAGYISVIIKINTIGAPTIIVNTFGGSKQISGNATWTGRKDAVFAESDGSTLTDAVLTWNSDYYKKPVWAFGDSYFANNTPLRWTYYVIYPWGFDNMLLNAYPGEGSASAYTDLMTALNHGTPKYLLWCIGMNDPDTGSAANATWLDTVQKVMAVCEHKGITLILATIPEVTANGYSNAYKNAYVESSDYRYIDFADAVDGVSGWLSEDGVHPSTDGAQLLAAKAITDMPELMQN